MKAIHRDGSSDQETVQGWRTAPYSSPGPRNARVGGAEFPSQGPGGRSGRPRPPAAHPQVLPPLLWTKDHPFPRRRRQTEQFCGQKSGARRLLPPFPGNALCPSPRVRVDSLAYTQAARASFWSPSGSVHLSVCLFSPLSPLTIPHPSPFQAQDDPNPALLLTKPTVPFSSVSCSPGRKSPSRCPQSPPSCCCCCDISGSGEGREDMRRNQSIQEPTPMASWSAS